MKPAPCSYRLRIYTHELGNPRKNHATKPPFSCHRLFREMPARAQSEHKNVRPAPKFLGPRN